VAVNPCEDKLGGEKVRSEPTLYDKEKATVREIEDFWGVDRSERKWIATTLDGSLSPELIDTNLTPELSRPIDQRSLTRQVLCKGLGASAGVHLALIALLLWNSHAPEWIEAPPTPSISVVFEPAATTVELAQAKLSAPQTVPALLNPLPPISLNATHRPVVRRRTQPPAAIPQTPTPLTNVETIHRPNEARATPARSEPTLQDSDLFSAYEAKLQAAVQDAAIYPNVARMQRRQGRARIQFEYADGKFGPVAVVASSGSAVLDRAAANAVERAQLPQPPEQIAARRLDFLIWVSFTLTLSDSSTDAEYH
jgi:TonB family protein